MLHNSIFASLINVDEIFRQIQRINAMVYKPIELYTALAMFFIVITVPLTLVAYYLKKKYAKDYSER
jgi:ABC-type amino acid transport system permease subunit